MKYVIIGNSAAGIGAVQGIRELDKDGDITMISDENYHTYSRPLISYWLKGDVTEEGMKYRPNEFYTEKLFVPMGNFIDKSCSVIDHNNEFIGTEKFLIAVSNCMQNKIPISLSIFFFSLLQTS